MASDVVNELDAIADAGPAITLAAAKSHLHVWHDDDDQEILALIDAATLHIETIVPGLVITRRNCRLKMAAWRTCFELPRWPFISLTSVTYTDEDDAPQDGLALFEVVEHDRTPAELRAGIGETLPALEATTHFPIVIEWVAGYASVPADLKHAIKLLLRHWYDNRGAVVVGTSNQKLKNALDSLLISYRPGHVAGVVR